MSEAVGEAKKPNTSGLSEEDKETLFLSIAQSVIANPIVKKLTDEMTDNTLKLNASGEG